jgi:hypothetical protein
LPGIQSAALTGFLPLTGSNLGVNITETRSGVEQKSSVDVNYITLDYFQTMGIEIRVGRPFATQGGAMSQQGNTRHFGLDQGVNPEVYLPYTQPVSQNPIYVAYLIDKHEGDESKARVRKINPAIRNACRIIVASARARYDANFLREHAL